MKRKIVQIAVVSEVSGKLESGFGQSGDGSEGRWTSKTILYALANDGSLWKEGASEWIRIKDLPDSK